MRRATALLVVALALARPGAVSAREVGVDLVDLEVLARAFGAAWNAHDVEGVVAFFAPDATVRQTRARVAEARDEVAAAPVIEDVYGAGRRPLTDAHDQETWAWGEVLWAADTRRLRAWLSPLFASGHHVEASAYRMEGDTVTWRYRAFADPYQQLAGVEPAAGTAQLLVHAGRIAAFAFASDGESVARRTRQFAAALDARIAAAWAAAPWPDPSSTRAPAAPAAAADAPDPRLPLGLLGAAALASLMETRRRRERPG